MKQKKLFLTALNTLIHSWDDGTPKEALWGERELLGWYKAEYGVPFDKRLVEVDEGEGMKQKELFLEGFTTILCAWGGDTPNEAIRAGNELIDWYEAEYNVDIGERLQEMSYDNDESNVDAVVDAITAN